MQYPHFILQMSKLSHKAERTVREGGEQRLKFWLQSLLWDVPIL